ncbi:hypothetical protein AB4209_02730 [Vibrio sp. 10N.286.48.C11]|uniref:hypothetical protein n=1 Tax=Vibrio sp. 10N.286.48.C11 TaxID=3229698 RepID=UPI00354FCDDB
MELVVASSSHGNCTIRLTDSFLLLDVQYEQDAFLVNLFDGKSHQFLVRYLECSPVEAWYINGDEKYQVDVDVIDFIERNEFAFSKENVGGGGLVITVSNAIIESLSA